MDPTAVAPVQLQRAFAASPAAVFAAWTDPQLMAKWLFKSDANEIIKVTCDLKPHGAFSILERASDGDLIDHFGHYREIAAPYRLAFSLEVPKHFSGLTEVTVAIEPMAEGCALTLRQTGVDPAAVEASWRAMFDRLASLFRTHTA